MSKTKAVANKIITMKCVYYFNTGLKISWINLKLLNNINCFVYVLGGERCVVPNRWEGNWFQSGVHQNIVINSSYISTKGKCLENDGDKFLLYNE